MRRIPEDRDRPQNDRDRLVDQVRDQSSHPRWEDVGTRKQALQLDPLGRAVRLLRGDGHLTGQGINRPRHDRSKRHPTGGRVAS